MVCIIFSSVVIFDPVTGGGYVFIKINSGYFIGVEHISCG